MKKLAKIIVCVALVSSVVWTATPTKQQNADVTGPGPMSVKEVEPMMVAVFETPGPHDSVSYKG